MGKMVEQNANDLLMIKDQIKALESRADKYDEEIESIRENNHKLTKNLEEQLSNFEDVIDKKINSDIMPRIGNLDDVVNGFENDIKSKFKPTEERLNGIDGQVQNLNTTVAVFESRHTETINKLKEVNVITNTIQTQIKDQEEKMVEQNANDLIMIKDQIKALESRADKYDEEIESIKENNH